MHGIAQNLSSETKQCALLYLTGTLPHVLHVCISHLGMDCGQWVIQLARWIYSQEQDKGLMGQSLER